MTVVVFSLECKDDWFTTGGEVFSIKSFETDSVLDSLLFTGGYYGLYSLEPFKSNKRFIRINSNLILNCFVFFFVQYGQLVRQSAAILDDFLSF